MLTSENILIQLQFCNAAEQCLELGSTHNFCHAACKACTYQILVHALEVSTQCEVLYACDWLDAMLSCCGPHPLCLITQRIGDAPFAAEAG